MKKEYETPRAEKMVFDYADIVTSSGGVTNKNPNNGCTVNEVGQTFQNTNKCRGGGPSTKNKKC